MTYSVPSNTHQKNQKAIIKERNMLSTTSFAISKQLEDVLKRSGSIGQRVSILLKSILNAQSRNRSINRQLTSTLPFISKINRNIKKLLKQQELFHKSIQQTATICSEVKDERENHIKAIEFTRNRRFYDDQNKNIDTVIEKQGRAEYDQFINSIKEDVFENGLTTRNSAATTSDTSKMSLLLKQHRHWTEVVDRLLDARKIPDVPNNLKHSYKYTMQAKRLMKSMIRSIQDIKQQEWIRSKNYLIRIGKFGAIAHMVHPKTRSGPIAGKMFPTKPGEPSKQAINDQERMEASLLTHQMWIDNPPGQVNCHFLEPTEDEIGINGVNINIGKHFDEEAEWNYLKGILSEQLPPVIAERVRQAHKRLPALFQHISKEPKLIHPFKYDCITGSFLYADLEHLLRKNAAAGNGKARATGFAVPVLGRLPKIISIETYLIQCKLQLTLRLLDL